MNRPAAAGRPNSTEPAAPQAPWTCPDCGHRFNGVEVILPGGATKRIPPPPEGKCAYCSDRQRAAEEAAAQLKEIQRVSGVFLKVSEIGPHYRSCSFDNFAARPGTEKALKYARGFVDAVDDKSHAKPWLLLFGDPGNGKTHLGMAIRNEIERRYTCLALATTQPYLLVEIQHSWNRKAEEGTSESWLLDKLQQARFALIDDLMPWKDWADDRMFSLLDGRYRNRRPTVFTSNHTPEEIEQFLGPRLWSRFAGYTNMVRVSATDYRLEVR